MLLRTRSESGTENVHYSFMHQEVTEKDRLYAERELNETEENKAEGIKKLKAYMKKEDLSCADDKFLIMVLRNCKYNITKSKSKLKRFLNAYQLMIKKVAKMNMEKTELILNDFPFGFLPWRDSCGRMVSYSRPHFRLDEYSIEDSINVVLAYALFALHFPLSSIYGVAHIADNAAPTVSYYEIFKLLRQALPCLIDFPFRISKLEVVNEHFFTRWLATMLYPFWPEKVRKRIRFHGSNSKSLHKLFHPDMLPEELEGTLGPLSCKHYRDELLKFIKEIKEMNQNV